MSITASMRPATSLSGASGVHRAARQVDQHRAVAQQREPAPIEHVPRRRERRRVQRDDVRAAQEVVGLTHFAPSAPPRRARGTGRGRGFEAGRAALEHEPADARRADDPTVLVVPDPRTSFGQSAARHIAVEVAAGRRAPASIAPMQNSATGTAFAAAADVTHAAPETDRVDVTLHAGCARRHESGARASSAASTARAPAGEQDLGARKQACGAVVVEARERPRRRARRRARRVAAMLVGEEIASARVPSRARRSTRSRAGSVGPPTVADPMSAPSDPTKFDPALRSWRGAPPPGIPTAPLVDEPSSAAPENTRAARRVPTSARRSPTPAPLRGLPRSRVGAGGPATCRLRSRARPVDARPDCADFSSTRCGSCSSSAAIRASPKASSSAPSAPLLASPPVGAGPDLCT